MAEKKEAAVALAGTSSGPAVEALVIRINGIEETVLVLKNSVADIPAIARQVADLLERNSALATRCDSLESHLVELRDTLWDALETKPLEALREVSIKEPRSTNDVFRDEHDSIHDDPEPHIKHRMTFGLTREQAEAAVTKRKTLLARELGIGPKARTVARRAAGAAALILGFLSSLFAPSPQAADYQGYPSAFIPLTNLPVAPTVTLTNGQGILFSQPNQGAGATNYIPLRANSGLGVESIFAIPYNGAWTNGTAMTNALGSEALYFYPSVDGTNALPLWATLTASPNITNAVIFGTNWDYLKLRGFAGIFVTVSNGCSLPIVTGGSITNIQNGSTNIYSAGVLVNRPNQ